MEQEEKWKPFNLNDRYHISSHGRIRSFVKHKDGIILSIGPNSLGYHKATLQTSQDEFNRAGSAKVISVHRLVAMHYIENPNNLPEVKHKDRNKSNNRADNLEWCTHQENVIHSFKTRIIPKGADHWNYGKKYSAEQKHAMSISKLGEKHPKFKGYYEKNGKKYPSSYEASRQTGENQRSISRQAHSKRNGWIFMPKDEGNALKTNESDVRILNANVPMEITNFSDQIPVH